jgi:hypothetical protein
MDPRGRAGMSALPAAGYLIEFGVKGRSGTPGDDMAARIEEAFARGSAEARAAARSECEAEIGRRSEEFARQLATDRQAWATETGDKLARQLTAGLRTIEESIANSLAHVLEPFLIAELRRQAIDELVLLVRGLMSNKEGLSLEVLGPDDLLAVLRERLAGDGPKIRFTAAEGSDVRVHADQTIIETQLGIWLAKIKEAVR